MLCVALLVAMGVSAVVALLLERFAYRPLIKRRAPRLVALISAVDHKHHAVITSASYAFRSTGSTIGITVASAVFQNMLKSGLWTWFGNREDADELIRRIRDSLDEIWKLPADLKPGVLGAYMTSLRAAFVTLLGLAIVGGAVSLGMRQHKLHSNLARRD